MNTVAMEKRPRTETSPEQLSSDVFYTPAVDIWENHDGFTFLMDLPGVKNEDIDIAFDGGVLTVEAKTSPRQGGEHQCLLQEYRVGNFRRSFDISTAIDSDGITAGLKNGELTLWVPKAQAARTRKVAVKSA